MKKTLNACKARRRKNAAGKNRTAFFLSVIGSLRYDTMPGSGISAVFR